MAGSRQGPPRRRRGLLCAIDFPIRHQDVNVLVCASDGAEVPRLLDDDDGDDDWSREMILVFTVGPQTLTDRF